LGLFSVLGDSRDPHQVVVSPGTTLMTKTVLISALDAEL